MSLLEVLFAASLASGLILFLGRAAALAFRWRATTRDVVDASERAEKLRAALAEAMRSAVPVEALTIGPSGEVFEGRGPGIVYESPRALVLRAYDEYWVIERSGRALVRRRIGRDGRTVADVLTDSVAAIAFQGVSENVGSRHSPPEPGSKLLLGLEWRLRFTSGEEAYGFVAARVDHVPARAIPAPPVAARWNGGKR
jgi:hypothetical protein